MVRVKVEARTNKVGSDNSTIIEFEDDEWAAMSDEEKEEFLLESMWELIEWHWEVI